MEIIEQIKKYIPSNEQEEKDKRIILEYLNRTEDLLLRTNEICHVTASGWIVNKDRSKVLMVYHNIYHSWSWTGGHADGEKDLLAVALREAREETGIMNVKPVMNDVFSLETLVVEGHEKKGAYVPCHLHMNVTYLLEADETEELRIKPDENSGVGWIPMEELDNYVTEPWMLERIYKKLVLHLSDG